MALSNKLAAVALGVAVVALIAGSTATYLWTATPPPTAGTTGAPGTNGTNGGAGSNGHNGANGTNGTNGANGSNGKNGTDGTNGTNGKNGTNGTTYVTEWYAFAPIFRYTGNMTYLNVTETGCTSPGEGATVCSFNVTNTCGPEAGAGIHPEWACKNWFYALKNVSFNWTTAFYFAGSNPSLGYAIGWGQNATVELWFQAAVVGIFPSNDIPPIPIIVPTITLGFGQVTG